MGTINHLLGVLGRLLLWVAAALVVEELTLAGLARLICRHVTERQSARAETPVDGGRSECSGSRLARTSSAPQERALNATNPKPLYGEPSCWQ